MSKLWLSSVTVLVSLSFGCGGSDDGPTKAGSAAGPAVGVIGLWVGQEEEVWQFNADGTFSDYDDEDGAWTLDGSAITLSYDEECVCSEFDLTGTLISDNELELDDFQGLHFNLIKSDAR